MRRLVGIDIGGTFTDFVLIDLAQGRVQTHKVSSTPADPGVGLVRGLREMDPGALEAIVHGTTVATNAILERKGARCGLIATRGFRDILELRRRDRPHAYGLTGSFAPLIPRDRRVEIDERVAADGAIVRPLVAADVVAAGERLVAQGVEGIVVALFNAYANPAHEIAVRQILAERWPELFVACAAEVVPLYGEFERTSTAAVNAYIQPVVSRYLQRVKTELESQCGYARELLVMQSNGGMLDAETIAEIPIQTVFSGPAAGVMGAARLGAEQGVGRLITYDMGGTSLDVALVVDGVPETANSTEIEFGIPVATSMIDVRTIGAGGGSIARIDAAGLLQIGPESAGADPGPVCYGRGGTDPTVTDALVVLGRINPDRSISGGALDANRAGRAIEERIAGPLGLAVAPAADAIVAVASNRISGSLRRISIDRGHDPRDFALFPFGGGGPLFASSLLKELGVAQAIVPAFPGIASAWGCAVADVRRDFVQMFNQRLGELDLDAVAAAIRDGAERGERFVRKSGVPVDGVEVVVEADAGFEGQTHVIRTPLALNELNEPAIRAQFRRAYDRRYGVGEIEFEGLADLLEALPIRILTVRTSVLGVRSAFGLKDHLVPPDTSLDDAATGERSVFVAGEYCPCPTFDRTRMPWGAEIEGPAVIEQADTTVWVEPEVRVHILEGGALSLRSP